MLRDPKHWRQVDSADSTSVSAAQKEIDAASEAAFVALGKDDASPAYRAFDGKVYTRQGVELVLEELGDVDMKAWTTEELIPVRCPHVQSACRMATLVREVKADHDSTGGIVTCVISGVPVGLGEPCFDKLEAMLAHGMLSLPATKGFEFGSGFAGTRMRGSQHNDAFVSTPQENEQENGKRKRERGSSDSQDFSLLQTKTNYAGGTLGGISNGADIVFRVAVKPVSTIGKAQPTAAFDGSATVLEAKGRHDPCVLPRTPPLIEAMSALVIADAAMIQLARVGATHHTPVHILSKVVNKTESSAKRQKQ